MVGLLSEPILSHTFSVETSILVMIGQSLFMKSIVYDYNHDTHDTHVANHA